MLLTSTSIRARGDRPYLQKQTDVVGRCVVSLEILETYPAGQLLEAHMRILGDVSGVQAIRGR